MQFISETVNDGVLERLFELDVNGERVPGVIWTAANSSAGQPVLLMGHGGSQHKKAAGLLGHARKYVSDSGFAVVAIDAPGHGERKQSAETAKFVAELQKKMAESQPVGELVTVEMARLASQAVPEWQATLDAVQGLDFVGAQGSVGYWGISMGGVTGVFLAAAEPRIKAAVLGLAGLFPGYKTLAEVAARVTVPVEFVLQWQDELVSKEAGLALFEALGSREKTLHANMGGHVRVPAFENESWERFFRRHLQI